MVSTAPAGISGVVPTVRRSTARQVRPPSRVNQFRAPGGSTPPSSMSARPGPSASRWAEMPSVPVVRGSGDFRSTHSFAPVSRTATCCRQKPVSGVAGSLTHSASSANPLPSRARPRLCASPGSPGADGIRGGAPNVPGGAEAAEPEGPGAPDEPGAPV